MTARKVHFDVDATQSAAFCGATPRGNAPALELSERRKDVTCEKCLHAMGAEHFEVAADYVDDNAVEAEFEALVATLQPNEPGARAWWENLADRHGLEFEQVDAGMRAGWLKR